VARLFQVEQELPEMARCDVLDTLDPEGLKVGL
jgi:hypothetical protein